MRRERHSFFGCRLVIILSSLLLIHPVFSVVAELPPDLTGYYYFVGKAPRGFEDVDWFSLATVETKGREAKLNGFVRLDRRFRGRLVNFDLVNPTLDDHTLTFSTKVVRGIRYQFRGQFLKLENLQDNETVLKGHLTKFRNGRTAAECDASFFYFTGD
jgi:hypothetical protein